MSITAERVEELEQYRAELAGYCSRLLRSATDGEDAAQETLVRAWRGLGSFEGRSALRSWLYRIATNVCFDMLRVNQRHAMAAAAAAQWSDDLRATQRSTPSDSPGPDPSLAAGAPAAADPADLALAREAVRLAVVAAIRRLPGRQRAVLILRDVLRWKADEVAALLGTTVPSVNSSLQRARAGLAQKRPTQDEAATEFIGIDLRLLTRYVEAFAQDDIQALTALLRNDATAPPTDR
jgi:RNA polymerase sigma-70 factor (ECF subfamily)